MHDTDDSTPPDPHTTEAKAALCDAVAPFVASLAATAEAQLRARATVADPLTLALARLCAREVNRLLKGEPQLPFLRPLRLAGDSVPPASLAAGLRALEAALGAFRARYYGWHKALGAPGWFIAGEDGDTAAWRQFTRPTEAPRPGTQVHGPKLKSDGKIRDLLIKRIEAIKSEARDSTAEVEDFKARIKRGELIANPSWVKIEASNEEANDE